MDRVVIWCTVVLPASETFVANQAGALRRWQPVFAGLERQANPFGIEAEIAPGSRLERNALWRTGVSPGLVRALARRDVGLVHAHFGTAAGRMLPSAVLARCPLVVTFHGYDVTVAAAHQDPGYLRRMRWVFRYASRLVAVSDFIAGRLLALGAPGAKVLVRHVGIPPGPDPGSVPRRRSVLFVGRLVEKKGCALLLRAVALLQAELGEPVQVDVIGDGPLRAGLEELAAGLGVPATFHGSLPPAGVAAHMRTAGVFCGPSITAANGDEEGFGMVFLEAAAARLPVVSHRAAGIVEAVADGHTGLLVEPGDVPALAAALRTVLTDPGLAARMGERGRRRVEADFDIHAHTAGLERLYDEVAGRRPTIVAA